MMPSIFKDKLENVLFYCYQIQGATTLNITIRYLTTLSTKVLFITRNMNDSQHNNTLYA